MPNWPGTPKTWSAVVVPVADMNTEVRDRWNWVKTWIGNDGYPNWTGIAKTAAYTLTTTDPGLVYVSGTFTLSLPAAPITGKPYTVKKTDSSGVVTVAGNTHTIDGSSTFLLYAYDALTFHYNGTEWSVT